MDEVLRFMVLAQTRVARVIKFIKKLLILFIKKFKDVVLCIIHDAIVENTLFERLVLERGYSCVIVDFTVSTVLALH
jgi:hypothetical protein